MSEENKQFDSETMAVVLYAMLESGISLGGKHYQLMSAIDPKGRTASSFDHQFRKVKARAKELKEQAETGKISTAPSKGKPRKRGRKASTELGDEVEGNEQASKKVKPEKSEDDEDLV